MGKGRAVLVANGDADLKPRVAPKRSEGETLGCDVWNDDRNAVAEVGNPIGSATALRSWAWGRLPRVATCAFGFSGDPGLQIRVAVGDQDTAS